MTAGHRLQGVVDLFLVASTDAAIIHDLSEPVANLGAADRQGGLANGQKMRAQTTDKPFDEDLENGSGNQGVE